MKTVENGAALLDERLGPGWVDQIDLDRLVLEEPCDCILGQLFGDYGEGLDALDLYSDMSSRRFGFNLWPTGGGHARDRWGSLTREWRRVISRRRMSR